MGKLRKIDDNYERRTYRTDRLVQVLASIATHVSAVYHWRQARDRRSAGDLPHGDDGARRSRPPRQQVDGAHVYQHAHFCSADTKR